jgi:hypothetical protein
VEAPLHPAPTVAGQADRYRWLQRLLEMGPGLISWAILIGPVWLSFSYPWLVAYFVLSFDFYWLCRAVWFSGAVVVAYRRISRVLAEDWTDRLRLLDSDRAGDAPASTEYTHLALIPTYTESLAKLRETLRALADAEWPADRRMVAIITRHTDRAGQEHVRALRDEFGTSFADFIHIIDPLEPGVVIGKSSAMAFGGRYLYGELVRERGMDPSRILITDLDADFRVHPQYFAYLTWMHLSQPNRETQLYQPIPYFHNNIWEAPFITRLFASVLTQLQMWRSVLPEKLQSFSSYSTTLKLVHEVGYWATDAIPEDSRFYWKSYFTYGERFRAVPLFMPIYGDAVRAGGYWRSLGMQYTQARRWAWGVTDIPYVVENAFRHGEIALASRIWRIMNLFAEHINWAVAPFVIMFGAAIPLLLNPAFGESTLGQNLPIYASTMLSFALVALAVLVWVEYRIAPRRPAHWRGWFRLWSHVQWIGLPFVGLFFSSVPALDAQTRLMTGRYLEYRVTEKA